ncbi:MAG: hypothetical protein COV74_10685 [Candidatus Omnitrophica bacterium CG11_big_fil_rev_8_21_14_0_20_45_26]|uniref:Uncharacterized protein n=1 Tax=Candidatus Abzuiibacterium crystallinum TaxID=1974748 RepID=A0A2H0LN04_9BACT|nr:MAG: hypothetical protein COV74_10685 [Candidatus Omnitrophica bacterium CG11_big_fil_rev_8_21_14_0_20_45_26]PIW63869.1 MAG: hypothetical protein COW12_08125 [Candidatus Omnitrophica bacterium CG12_big_fil_rev_8_21_14_0_65_45_16]
MKRFIHSGALLGAFFLLTPHAVWAGTCALCKQALASGGWSGLVQGFYWSIILIGGIPLIILGTAGVIVFRIWKAENKASSNSTESRSEEN